MSEVASSPNKPLWGDTVVPPGQQSKIKGMRSFADMATSSILSTKPGSTCLSTAASSSLVVGNGQSAIPTVTSSSKQVSILNSDIRGAYPSAVHGNLMLKDARSRNVIIYGLPSKPGVSDAVLVDELVKAEFDYRPPIARARRLGRVVTGQVQLIDVTCWDFSDAVDPVEHVRLLRDSHTVSVRQFVYLNRDMTRAKAQTSFEHRNPIDVEATSARNQHWSRLSIIVGTRRDSHVTVIILTTMPPHHYSFDYRHSNERTTNSTKTELPVNVYIQYDLYSPPNLTVAPPSALSCRLFHGRGLCNELLDFNDVLVLESLDIIVITEMNLK